VTEWRNRIIATGEESPDQLLANPLNFRRHPKHQQEALRGVLNEVGWVQDVIVNRTTGHLIDGHLRVELALRDNAPTVPVKYVDLSAAEEALILATFDPIGALANADRETLAALLEEVSTGEAAVQQMIAEMAEREGIAGLGGGTEGLTDADEVPEPPEEPVSCPGDLWVLGKHRVLCGDSTDGIGVRRLLDGAVPDLTVTDPPYGVEYDANWRNEAAEKGLIAHADRRVGVVANDDRIDWSEAFSLVPSSVIYCWHAGWHASTVQRSLEDSGYEVRSQIILAKSRFAISRGHYHWQHEACWYAVRKGATAHWVGDRSQTTLWEIALDANVDGGHSTQKPVECMERPIRNHEGDVYDPFLGSGTTLIAAERQGRRCYGVELNPAYVDVIVRRWEAFTGRTAELHRTAEAAD
jgi:DNA modification methylase